MVDIHTHIIPNVDDGSESLSISLNLLQNAIENGTTDLICTPHFRKPYLQDYITIRQNFDEFVKVVKEKELPINLYLGREVFCAEGIRKVIEENNFFIEDSKYILLEFTQENHNRTCEIVYELGLKGYIPIIAHIERYDLSIEDAFELKESGALIQVNADSIVGKYKKDYLKFIKQLFNNGLVDFVASDIHNSRENLMKEAYQFVSKKYGKQCAEAVFINNGKKIISNM